MSTNNKGKKIKSEIQQQEVVEDVKTLTTEDILTNEPVVFEVPVQVIDSEESFEVEPPAEEPVAEVPTAVGAPFDEEIPPVEAEKEEVKENVFNFQFQKDYFLGTPNTDKEVSIDTLEEPKCDLTLPIEAPFIPVMETPAPKRKTLAQMTACELNIYHKTGILPLL